MALDGILLNKITTELKETLPLKINKIYQVSNTEILFNVKSFRAKHNLIISCHSLYNRIHLTNKSYPTPEEPNNFIMLLRKHIDNGTIYNIEQGNLDRYLKIEIAHRSEIGDKETKYLYVELMGKYANIILVNEDGKILDALKRIPPFENNKRTIQPGAKYTLPDAQNKLNPFINFEVDPHLSLTKQFEGFSPLLSKETQYRMDNQETFKNIMEQINNSNKIYICNINNELQYHLIPLTHLSSSFKKLPINEAMDYIYFSLEEKDRIKQLTGDMFKFVKKQLKHQNGKLPKLYESLDEANNSDVYREYGELLYAYNIVDTKGKNKINLVNFEGNEVTIPLDPKLDGKGNAKKCFQKYNKGKKGKSHIEKQIEISLNEIEYLQAIEEQLELANFKDAEEIREELVKNGYLKAKISKIRKKKKNTKDIPSFISIEYNGHTISFGKNNLQNDFLTWKYASKNDTWFHAKDFHGSHLICSGNDLDEDTIRTCAKLAAYFSKGRYSSSVPVNYTLVKNLKKIPGSKLGLVSLSTYNTIYIDPIEDEINNILKKS